MVSNKELEGRKFCIVFAQVDETNGANGKIKMKAMHGRASISDRGEVILVGPGGRFGLPTRARPNILPSDGTEILKDAEYFAIVKVQGMDL